MLLDAGACTRPAMPARRFHRVPRTAVRRHKISRLGPAATRKGLFYGWWIVIACWTITLYGSGIFFYGFSVFFQPIVTEFGWSRAVTSGAFALSQAEGFIEGPIIGPLVDKYGPRKLMFIGITMVSIGFVALSLIDGLLAFYVVYVLLLAVGFNTGFFIAAQAAVGNWFIRRRSLALGLLTTAFGFSGAVMVPIIAGRLVPTL